MLDKDGSIVFAERFYKSDIGRYKHFFDSHDVRAWMGVGTVPEGIELPAEKQVTTTGLISAGIEIDYENRESIGVDRVVCAYAGFLIFKKPVLALTIGTTITATYITANGVIKGGSISPGLTARFNTLAKGTAQLPKLDANLSAWNRSWLGRSTNESIRNGVINGIIAELESMLEWWKNHDPEIIVFAGGGDHQIFQFIHSELPLHVEPFIELYALATLINYGIVGK
ncbi:MAG: type III pantothenate kinase [Chlorobi bacterium]|nr:type III pantothenate kinase [Chlorobiota bacterium]